MRVSVIIITKDRLQRLNRAMRSILRGSMIPDELIIVDNASVQDVKGLVQRFAKTHPFIRYVREEKLGYSNARNAGLDAARGDIIAFTDDDCVAHTDWIKSVIAGHTKHPEVAAIGGKTLPLIRKPISYASHILTRYGEFWDTTLPYTDINKKMSTIFKHEHFRNAFATNNLSFKKKAIAGMRFNPELPASEDYDFCWRLFEKDAKNILYDPKMIVYHKYRQQFIPFVRQMYQYGRNNIPLLQNAREQGYLPTYARTRFIKQVLFYFRFVVSEVRRSPFGLLGKLSLFLLVIIRSVSFIIGEKIAALQRSIYGESV